MNLHVLHMLRKIEKKKKKKKKKKETKLSSKENKWLMKERNNTPGEIIDYMGQRFLSYLYGFWLSDTPPNLIVLLK